MPANLRNRTNRARRAPLPGRRDNKFAARMIRLNVPVLELACELIGATLLIDGVGGVIVETEAYAAAEEASHSYGGPRKRNAVMFGPVGRAYVYRIYGLHWCLNVVGGERPGSAVLIRALEPTHGLEAMAARLGLRAPTKLCNGPGKLAQALGVDGSLNGRPLDQPPFQLMPRPTVPTIVTGPRIGIKKATELPWRFGLERSSHLSRPFASVTQAG